MGVNTQTFTCAREDCEHTVVLPQMSREDTDALLELNGWRRKWPMYWICDRHEEETIIEEQTDGQ